MFRTTVQVEGMMCSMCENHVSEAVRKAFDVKSVRSSRRKKQTVIESEAPLDPDAVLACIHETGYEALGTETEEITGKKFRLFGR